MSERRYRESKLRGLVESFRELDFSLRRCNVSEWQIDNAISTKMVLKGPLTRPTLFCVSKRIKNLQNSVRL